MDHRQQDCSTVAVRLRCCISVAEGPELTAQRRPDCHQETIMPVPAWNAERCPAPGA